MHHLDKGAFTGEVSAPMLKSCGCDIVELAHAERYKYYNESDTIVNKKIKQALKYKLIPLICVGEKKREVSYNKRINLLKKKINIFFSKIEKIPKNQKIILAYEPIWAIGKSKSASIAYTENTINFIKNYTLKKLKIQSNQLFVIYGGSVNKKNARNFIKSQIIDGIFIGRSAINAKDFIKICKMVDL